MTTNRQDAKNAMFLFHGNRVLGRDHECQQDRQDEQDGNWPGLAQFNQIILCILSILFFCLGFARELDRRGFSSGLGALGALAVQPMASQGAVQ